MTWLAKLAERRKIFQERPGGVPTKPTKPGYVSFVSTQEGHSQNIRSHLLALAAEEGIDPELVRTLDDDDLACCEGLSENILRDYVAGLASSKAELALRESGIAPADETAVALCKRCGPVWVHPHIAKVAPVVAGIPTVLGCPWCFVKNRDAIPRPRISGDGE